MESDARQNVWRDGFLFVGNQIALDFVNTRPLVDGSFVELLQDVEALLRWFVAAELIDAKTSTRLMRKWRDDDRSLDLMRSLRGFRERLREDVIGWEDGRDVRKSTLK